MTHIQKSSDNLREVFPTTKRYITASGKQAPWFFQSAASLVPVPLLQEANGVAPKIIQVCEVRGEILEEVMRWFMV